MGKGTEGIRLEFQTMYNPGFRQVAKIMLNSVWGNFQGGQDRSVLETAKFSASLTNLVGPTTLIRSLGALERTLFVLRHRVQPTKVSRSIQRCAMRETTCRRIRVVWSQEL